MVHTTHDLNDATTFERFTLAEIFPPVERDSSETSLDLRGGKSCAKPTNHHEILPKKVEVDAIRPLLFSAAWKVLDLLFELAFHQVGLKPSRATWTINEKKNHAVKYEGCCPPLSSDQEIWERLCCLYVNTVEARHCLIHRRFEFSSGTMTNIRSEKGEPQTDITASEQEAFCRTAWRVADACISSRFSNRERLDLVHWLDELAEHHKLPKLERGDRMRTAILVQLDAVSTANVWSVDLERADKKARENYPTGQYYDVEIHFPDSDFESVVGRLEEAPKDSAVFIDPMSPPRWAIAKPSERY